MSSVPGSPRARSNAFEVGLLPYPHYTYQWPGFSPLSTGHPWLPLYFNLTVGREGLSGGQLFPPG